MERSPERLSGVDMYFLTPAPLDDRHIAARWPRLATSPGKTWGHVDLAAWMRTTGVAITPSFFVVDSSGTLRTVIRGEMSLEALLRS